MRGCQRRGGSWVGGGLLVMVAVVACDPAARPTASALGEAERGGPVATGRTAAGGAATERGEGTTAVDDAGRSPREAELASLERAREEIEGRIDVLRGEVAASTLDPIALVKAYLAAERWEDRLAYVSEPRVVRPLMARRYRSVAFPVGEHHVDPTPRSMDAGEDWARVSVAFVTGRDRAGRPMGHVAEYYLQQTPRGHRIDWEASTGHNPMTLAAFREELPRTPVELRLTARIDGYYNHEFLWSRTSHASLELSDARPGRPGDTVHGYVARDDASAREVLGRLGDGEKHKVLVTLRYSPEATSPECAHVVAIRWGWVKS